MYVYAILCTERIAERTANCKERINYYVGNTLCSNQYYVNILFGYIINNHIIIIKKLRLLTRTKVPIYVIIYSLLILYWLITFVFYFCSFGFVPIDIVI